ncbi:CGNR zinc finger domain-containing protein [Streptomyces sp. NPDC005336]
MLYLDRTAARRRRWCSMRRCGNSAKAATHRKRATTAPGGSADS